MPYYDPSVITPAGTLANQFCTDEGLLTLERSKTVAEEKSSHVIDFLDCNDTRKPEAVLHLVQSGAYEGDAVLSDTYYP